MLSWVVLGYVAGALVFAAFWMKTPRRLRQVAIASNVLYIAYGASIHSAPTVLLHAALMPLNIWRLMQLEEMLVKVRAALNGEIEHDWLGRFTTRHHFAADTYLFRKNDAAGPIYFIVDGQVQLTEIGLAVGPGQLLGEMAIFAQGGARSLSARAETPVTALSLTRDELLVLYQKNPQFGLYLVQLITKRLLQDVNTLERMIVVRTAERERFRELAAIDEQTSLPNEKAFTARLQMEWARATRGAGGPISLVVVAGTAAQHSVDEMRSLAEAAVVCASRSTDFVARRRNEISVLLPGTPAEAAQRIAGEIAAEAERAGFGTVLGIATHVPQRDEAPETLVFHAEEALLHARLGRHATLAATQA